MFHDGFSLCHLTWYKNAFFFFSIYIERKKFVVSDEQQWKRLFKLQMKNYCSSLSKYVENFAKHEWIRAHNAAEKKIASLQYVS